MQITPHEKKIKEISKQLKKHFSSKDKRKIRFFHGSTNSTRVQDKSDSLVIDISKLDQVLTIDKKKRIVVVEPNVSMEKLVSECLKYNLIPKVVMEFPAITCGGAVNGAALESSSYKYGQFNDICLEYECILGDGSIVKANRVKNADLFYGISGSYGTFAFLSAITISLIPAKPFVKVEVHPIHTDQVAPEIKKFSQDKSLNFLDAIVFSKEESVIITAFLEEHPSSTVVTFTKPKDEWFYLFIRSIIKRGKKSMSIPLKDFLFRYNKGGFWAGQYAYKIFHTPFNKVTRRALNRLMDTKIMYNALHKSNTAQDAFIQDFYIPLSKTKNFLGFTDHNLGIYPLWICPVKSVSTLQILSPHFLKEEMLIDIGIWGAISKGKKIVEVNQLFEEYLEKIGGRKMLYAENFYTKETFWDIYDFNSYQKLRKRHKAERTFPDIWEKTHVEKRYPTRKWRALAELFIELLKNKYSTKAF